MPVSIKFDVARTEDLLERLALGGRLGPSDVREWTVSDLLALAAACLYAARSHGPVLQPGVEWDRLPAERREAITRAYDDELLGAVGCYAGLTAMVDAGGPRHLFEPWRRAVVFVDGDGLWVAEVEGGAGGGVPPDG